MEKEQNFQRVKGYFEGKLAKIGYEGIFGVASFQGVYHDLMPIQRSRLEDICGDQFHNLMKNGSIICIGIAYPEHVIDCIGAMSGSMIDIDTWSIYAREYQNLNRLLNTISKCIADQFGGIPILATMEGVADKVTNVRDYYGMTVSHRVIAEYAGLGWRGKNELIVNKNYSCALRFASIITNLPLTQGEKVETSCGACNACLEVCSFLKNKERLKNYRENCRRYIMGLLGLGLVDEVCGRCIKACYRDSVFKDTFKLR